MLHDAAQNEVSNDVVSLDVTQAGAICHRRDRKGRLEVLLVDSRRNGRGVPKGHIEGGEPSSAAGLREAFEEAGIIGVVDSTPFGNLPIARTRAQTDTMSRFIS